MKTEVNTKVTIKKETRSFNLTIDWTGMTPEDERALAQRSIVIAWQNGKRTANKGQGEWPEANPSIKALDFRIGHTRQPADPVKLVEAGQFSKEELERLAALIKQKMANQKG